MPTNPENETHHLHTDFPGPDGWIKQRKLFFHHHYLASVLKKNHDSKSPIIPKKTRHAQISPHFHALQVYFWVLYSSRNGSHRHPAPGALVSEKKIASRSSFAAQDRWANQLWFVGLLNLTSYNSLKSIWNAIRIFVPPPNHSTRKKFCARSSLSAERAQSIHPLHCFF